MDGPKIDIPSYEQTFGAALKDTIIETIYNKINEVKNNGFIPMYIVLGKTAYSSLVAHFIEKDDWHYADDKFPLKIFNLPIILLGKSYEIEVLTDAKHEFQYDVRGP